MPANAPHSKPQLAEEILVDLRALATISGCELVHAAVVGKVLRLVIDRPEGVTLADCENVSRQASALLDAVDFGSDRYVLEVGSPGLDRPLYAETDYDRFAGKLAHVTYRAPDQVRKRTVLGRLGGRDDGGREVILEVVQNGTSGETLRLPLSWISAARLEPEL